MDSDSDGSALSQLGFEGSNGMSPQRDRAVGQITEEAFNATMSETEKEGERKFPFRLVRRTTSVYVAESVARTVTLRRSCLVGRTAGKLELFFQFRIRNSKKKFASGIVFGFLSPIYCVSSSIVLCTTATALYVFIDTNMLMVHGTRVQCDFATNTTSIVVV